MSQIREAPHLRLNQGSTQRFPKFTLPNQHYIESIRFIIHNQKLHAGLIGVISVFSLSIVACLLVIVACLRKSVSCRVIVLAEPIFSQNIIRGRKILKNRNIDISELSTLQIARLNTTGLEKVLYCTFVLNTTPVTEIELPLPEESPCEYNGSLHSTLGEKPVHLGSG